MMEWPLVLFSVFCLFLVSIKLFFLLGSKSCKSDKRMDGKTVLITGASAGIGKETARDLAFRGARLILGCRNLVKAQAVADSIIKETGNQEIFVHKLDTSDLYSVRTFAKIILETENKLDVLINNAGIGAPSKRVLTVDGLEMTMATNHYGHFLLTNLLLGLLKRSGESRIINVSSIVHLYIYRLDPEDLNFEKASYGTFSAYSQSKLCQVLFTLALSEKLNGTRVTVNSLHPGFVSTEIATKTDNWLLRIVMFFVHHFIKSSKSGAQTTIYLAVSDEVANVSGKYFADCQESKSSRIGEHRGFAKKLWLASELDVKLQSEEIHY